jgi:hypothetical protein
MVESDFVDDAGEGVPVCLKCLEPVAVGEYYCAKCGEASNPLTPSLPFVGIRWGVDAAGRNWGRIWDADVAFFKRLLSLLLMTFAAPVVLVGVIFIRKKKVDSVGDRPEEESKKPDKFFGFFWVLTILLGLFWLTFVLWNFLAALR